MKKKTLKKFTEDPVDRDYINMDSVDISEHLEIIMNDVNAIKGQFVHTIKQLNELIKVLNGK